jgi:serine protease
MLQRNQRLYAFLLILVLLVVSTASAVDFKVKPMKKADKVKLVKGELVVKFKADVSDATAAQVIADLGCELKSNSKKAGKFKSLKIKNAKSIEQMVADFKKSELVEYAEPNSYCYAMAVPNDPYYSPYQWHFDNPVYGGIDMENAWDVIGGGSSSVIVGILDTGVAYENYGAYAQAPDLAGTNFVAGYDFINNDSHPNDDEGHGTHVCGTIAQTTNNGIGVAGIAYNSSIMPVKILDSQGSGTATALAEGLYWATDNGADVINMSLGWPPGYDPGATVENAIAYAYNHGVTLIAASGNDDATVVGYPAAYDDYVIAVGATRYDEAVSYYSNTGSSLDVTAPGGDVTIDQNGDGYVDGVLQMTFDTSPTEFSYYFFQGTSMATPHVVGVAALLIANGTTGPDNVRAALENTAEDKGAPGWDSEYGHGIIDAFAALNYNTTPPENRAPVADAGGPYSADVGVSISFDGTGSYDPDGDTITYDWDFGDGATATGATPSHAYAAAGTYTATLVVNDGEYDSNPAYATVTISEPGSDPTMVVSNIALSLASRRDRYSATATVTVLDDAGNPVSGATVSAHWSGAYSANVSLTTGTDGKASHVTKYVRNPSSPFVFSIDDVVKSGYIFDETNSVMSSSVTASASAGVALSNFPNPANPSTRISFAVPEPADVQLDVFNTLGQKVRTLVSDYKAAGAYDVMWDGLNESGQSVVSGMYFVRMNVGGEIQTLKILLAK